MSEGKVTYEVEVDDSKVDQQISQTESKIESSAQSAEKKVKSSASSAASEVVSSSQKAERGLDGVESAAKGAASGLDQIDDSSIKPVDSSAEKAAREIAELRARIEELEKKLQDTKKTGGGFLDGVVNSVNGVLQNVLGLKGVSISSATAIGGAFVAAGGYAVNAANDMQGAMNQFSAATGVSGEALDEYEQTLKDIYAGGYGESIGEIAGAMANVKQQLGDISQTDLKTITEGVYTLSDVFGADFNETLRGVDQLMVQFGISAEDALDLMLKGSQNGLNYTDELGDNISEYAGKFAQAGYSAEDYFQLLQNGTEGGAYNLDKVNDAINEVTTRLADGTIEEALGSFDENTQNVFKAWQNGEATQKDVVDAIVANIQNCTNEQEALTLAATAFGTMGEDANLDFVASLTSVGDTYDDVNGKMEEMQEVKYDDLTAQLEALKRSVEQLLVPLGEALIPLLSTLLEAFSPVVEMLGESLTPAFDMVAQVIQSISPMLETLVGFCGQLIEISLQLVGEALTPLFDIFMQILEPVGQLVSALLGPLTQLFEGLLEPLTTLISEAMEPILGLFNDLLSPLTSLISGLLPPLQSLFNGLTPILEALFDALTPVFDALGMIADTVGSVLSPVLRVLAEIFTGVLGVAIDNIMGVLDSLLDVFGGVIDFIAGVFSGNWEQAWNGIVRIFKGIFNTIPSAIQSVINAAIGVINGIIGGINTVTGIVGIPKIPKIPTVSIPRFHAGGIVDFEASDEGLALLKNGEMVLTQAQQAELFAAANGIGSLGGSERPISLNVTLTGGVEVDGFTLGKIVLRNLDDAAAYTLRGG